ncbi:shieldin complex subunit 1 isoform X2 [Alligator mississippiensis]|uniref:shieldin complex subunit 1 isoform X2 n=1 Tax=Alligator mississippiensis TaxID=8496 RepID=UPI0009072275|nr:shieldin complex subunit 1 isoform X2 [Alligator mississippiensis]
MAPARPVTHSVPAALLFEAMEGDDASLNLLSEENSIVDLPSACDLSDNFLPQHSAESSDEPFSSVQTFASSISTGDNSQDPEDGTSLVTMGFWTKFCEKANPRHHSDAEFQPSQPSDILSSWTSEHEGTNEGASIKNSLKNFYEKCCQVQPGQGDPAYKAASQCLSQKISELASKDGTKYALRSLQIAQMVLNRDDIKVFPNHSRNACFSAPADGEATMNEGKKIPGLSDDVLRFLLKQDVVKYSS